MKKFFIIATGIYMLLLTLFNALIGVSGFLIPSELEQTQTVSPFIMLLLCMPFILWLAATGIGLFMNKNWARISILVMSGFGILVGVSVCAVFGFMDFPETVMDSASAGVMKMAMIGFSGFFLVVLPSIYLVFFTRKSVVLIFTDENEVASASKRPTGITVLAILALVGAFFSLVSVFTSADTPIPLFGFLLEGLSMKAYMLLIIVANAYLAFGFWRLHKSAWITAVGLYSFGLAATIFNAIFLDPAVLMTIAGQSDSGAVMNPVGFKILWGLSALWSILLLAYLISRKAAFYRSEPE